MSFCLPKEFANKFLDALKEGKINPEELAQMSSEERRNFLEPIVGKEDVHEVNAQLESKLLLQDQKRGMVSWAKKVAGISEPVRSDLISRIQKMDKVLSPEDQQHFLEDLAAKKLGADVTLEEASKIVELSKRVQDTRDSDSDSLSGVSDEYLKARTELESYVASLKPATDLSMIGKNLAVIARNNLLLNPATPIKTIIGQVVNSTMDAVTRRIGAISLKSQNPELVSTANKEAWSTFMKTGYNTVAMENIGDTHVLGKGENFKLPKGMSESNGTVKGVEKAVRKTAAISNKVAIDWEHNIAFTKFYQKAFFDMTNVMSSNLVKQDGLSGDLAKSKAADIFKDAARIEPKTDLGAMVRLEAQKQAARVTSTNETYLSRLSLLTKDSLNKMIPGFPLGDAVLPIAKIPANIIANGIENAGVGIPLGIKDIYDGHAKIQSEDLHTRYQGMAQFSNGIQKVARSVGTIGLSYFIANQFTKKDFKSDQYGNHFIKIGNTWINMEYIAAISPSLAGFMYTKEYAKPNDTAVTTANHYASGAGSSLLGVPGIDELSSLVSSITNSNYTKGIQKYASDFFSSRGVPAFIPNLLNNRPIDRLFFGAHGVESTQEVKADAEASAKKSAQARKLGK